MDRRRFLITAASVLSIAAVPSLRAETSSERARLFAALKAAETEREGRLAESAIWEWWFDQAPTSEVREAIDFGMKRRSSYDFEAAEEAFDKAIDKRPNMPRAGTSAPSSAFCGTIPTDALSDLEKAVALEPDHFGAWSGMYHVLMRMGRTEVALSALTRAVTIHPWIQERGLLPPDPDAKRPVVKGKQQEL
jgi:tetratricopeptide (TPR) repeat protein